LEYKKGSKERQKLEKEIEKARSQVIDIPMVINGKKVTTDKKIEIRPPHDIKHLLGYYYRGNEEHVQKAIDAALNAKRNGKIYHGDKELLFF